MPVGTSAAMAGVASAQAAAASAAAHAARVAQCKTVLPNFNAQGATVSEMHEYADCVGTLYPIEMGADVTIALKVVFIIALSGLIGGAAHSRFTSRWDGWGEHAMMGVMWFFMAPVAAGFVAGVLYGIRWLLT